MKRNAAACHRRKLCTDCISTLCVVDKVKKQNMPEKLDIITADKPEPEKSGVRAQRQSLPQVSIKMSGVFSNSERRHTSRCLHGIIGCRPCMGTDTLSCETHFIRVFKECVTGTTKETQESVLTCLWHWLLLFNLEKEKKGLDSEPAPTSRRNVPIDWQGQKRIMLQKHHIQLTLAMTNSWMT